MMNNRRTAQCLVVLLLAGLLTIAQSPAQKNDKAELLLQAAIHKQLVEGDLEGAIQQYKSIVASFGSKFSEFATRRTKRPGPHLNLSPDGRYVAYDFPQKEDFGPRDISILSSDGSGEAPLVQHPAHDYVLTWTPDGKNLIFASDRTSSLSAWIVEVEAGKPHGSPRLWKPDIGRATPLGFTQKGSFYYAVDTSVHDLYTASFDFTTGKVLKPPALVSQLFTGSNNAPDWSPDGKYLAYLSVRHQLRSTTPQSRNPTDTIVILSLETSEEREIVPDLKLLLSVFGLRWAADSQSLLVYGRDKKGGVGLFRIDAQTANVSTLIQLNYDSNDHPWYGRVAPSPDGKALVLVKNGKGFGAVVLRDLETGQERELAHAAGIHDIGLSPDGSQVAYTTQDEPSTGLWVVPVAGGEPRELLRLKPSESFPWDLAWTRDGSYIVFCKEQNKWSQQKVELWRISASGGQPVKLELSMDRLLNFSLDIVRRCRPEACTTTWGCRCLVCTGKLQADGLSSQCFALTEHGSWLSIRS